MDGHSLVLLLKEVPVPVRDKRTYKEEPTDEPSFVVL